MNHCDETESLLSAYFDGECTPGETLRVRSHLRVCPACRRQLQEYALIRKNFPHDSEILIPRSLSANVMSAIRSSPAPRTRRCRNLLRKILLPLAACLVITLALPNSSSRSLQTQHVPAAQAPSTSSPCAKPAQRKRSVVRKKVVKKRPEQIFSSQKSVISDSAAPKDLPADSSAASAASSDTERAAQPSGAGCLSCSAPYHRWISVTADAAGSLLDSFSGTADTDPVSGETAVRYELSTADFSSISAQISGASIHVNSSAGLTLCCIYVLSDH